jgi:hypothetical protein
MPDTLFKESFMLKKYMIFGSVVLFMAALLTLAGCTQATSSEGGTVTYAENYLYGVADETVVKAAITAAKARDRVVVLTKDLKLAGSKDTTLEAIADFENLTIRIEGQVNVENMIINAPFANMVFEPGARMNLDDDSVFIYDGEPDDKNISEGAKVKYVRNPLTGTQGTDQKIAVLDYTIGGNFYDIHSNVTELYVLNTLTINAGSAAPGNGTTSNSPIIHALGTVDLAATPNSAVFEKLGADLVLSTNSVLKSTGQGVTLTLPTDTSNSATNLPTIEAAAPLTIVTAAFGAGTGESSIADVKGPETVTLNATAIGGALTTIAVSESGKLRVTTATLDKEVKVYNAGRIEFDAGSVSAGGVVIEQNTGEVIFKNNLTLEASMLKAPANNGSIIFQGDLTAAAALGSPSTPADNIAGSGKVEITGATTFTAGPVNIDCAIVFNDDVTVTAGTVTIGGDVTLANEKTITFAATDPLTLKAGKTFFVGTEPVLAAGDAGVVITPVATAVLTAGAALEDDEDPEEVVTYKTLSLGTAGAAITSGELRVRGILETGAALTVTGALTLDAGGILLIDTTGTVVLGDTTIDTADGQLAAAGGAVTLTPNTITGRGSTLQVPEDATGPTITVAKTSKTLTLAGANLDLQYGGSLVIKGDTSVSKVILDSGSYPGKLTLGEDTIPYTGVLAGIELSGGSYNATLSGTGVLLGDDATEPTSIGQLSGTGNGLVTITGTTTDTQDVEIEAGATIVIP